MIKKLLLSRILLSGLCFGFTTQVMAEESIATPDNIETKKIVLKDLDFKTVMLALYQKDIKFLKVSELEQEKIQYVGMQGDQSENSKDTVLAFNPAEVYKNAQNEDRYLLTVTQFFLSDAKPSDDHHILLGFPMGSDTQVFVFKKNLDQNFEIVSRSFDDTWSNQDWNYQPYPAGDIIKNIKNIGPEMLGYVEEKEQSAYGINETQLMVMALNDQAHIQKMKVAEIGLDNESSNEDKTYNMQAKYRFLKSEHDGLYDIEIKFSGTKKDENADKIIPIKEIHVYQYNEKQQKYVRVK